MCNNYFKSFVNTIKQIEYNHNFENRKGNIMDYKPDTQEDSTLTIVEAVETLSNIADLEFDRNVSIAEKHDLVIHDKPLIYHSVHWLHQKDANATVSVVKETFKVILNYLRNFYRDEYASIYDPQALEGIKTIMVLVGEAARKLDKYTAIFHAKQAESVTQLKEYKKLQDFYLTRIARKIDEGVLGKWILGLTQRVRTERPVKKKINLQGVKGSQSKHVFIDLESVKKDTEYELFMLRKEDGTRFFNPRLIRNIKLVSDFGSYFGEEKQQDDPLQNIDIWQDRVAYASAKAIIGKAIVPIEKFFQLKPLSIESDLAMNLYKAIMALLLANNPHNLSHNLPIKNCCDYFHDFQVFLRYCLRSREYENMIAYPPSKADVNSNRILATIQNLCQILYAELDGLAEISSWIHGLINQAKEAHPLQNKEETGIITQMTQEYTALSRYLKTHSNGPLNKILEALESGEYREFDPLIQKNFPSQLFTLHIDENKCNIARWPSPTHQEFINKATVTDEFKAFLYGIAKQDMKCLMINLQDRAGWKDCSRCIAIEDLTKIDTLQDKIEVITLAKDTEFYHQLAPYSQENHADVFIKTFEKQLNDDQCGFYFPMHLKKVISQKFIKEMMQGVHKIFFSGKNILLREHRMDFIEIFYQFLIMKIIEMEKPSYVGFTCKDSIDIGACAGAELFVFMKMLTQERLSESDQERLDLMLYGPALLYRERIMLPERFNRMVSALKVIESARKEYGQSQFVKVIEETFGKFYSMLKVGF